MSFSDRQIRILRSRLRAYYVEAGKRERGRKFSWNLIGVLIYDKLGLDFDVGGRGGDRLGKFVDGEPKETGSKERRSVIPETRRLAAIRDFLMHPDIRYLAAYEMEDDPELPVAARVFADFLEDEGGAGNPPVGVAVSSEQIKGVYECARGDTELVRNHTLSLILLSDRLFEAEEVTEYFDTRQALTDFSQWSLPERYRRRRTHKRSTGWAVKNKYDCLYVFLKDQADSSFTSYIASGREALPYAEADVHIRWLYLQNYGPFTYFASPIIKDYDIFEVLAEELKKKSLFLFKRIESFPAYG